MEKAQSKPPIPVHAPTPSGSIEYPLFPASDTDFAPFLNAMFGIFNRAMAPSGAPTGPVGPLAFSIQMPSQQASFMPFTSVYWLITASTQQSPQIRMPSPSPAYLMMKKRAPLAPRSRTKSSTWRRSEAASIHSSSVQQETGLAPRSTPVPETVAARQEPHDTSTQSVPPAQVTSLGKRRGPDYDQYDVLGRGAW